MEIIRGLCTGIRGVEKPAVSAGMTADLFGRRYAGNTGLNGRCRVFGDEVIVA
jgi:hypothetical protein